MSADQISLIAAIASAVAAVVAVYVAYKSVKLSDQALAAQSTHNKLSVRPIPFIACADYLHRLRVKIYNNGTGPYIIENISVSDGKEVRPDIISWMPSLPKDIFWNNFTSGSLGRAVSPGDGLNLLELVGDMSNPEFVRFRTLCRNHLKNLTVTLEYTDIYGDKFAPCVRHLAWFDR